MGQCCSAPRNVADLQTFPAVAGGQPLSAQNQVGLQFPLTTLSMLTQVSCTTEHPVCEQGLTVSAPGNVASAVASPHSGSATSSLSPASEKRRRAVAASPTRFFELLVCSFGHHCNLSNT